MTIPNDLLDTLMKDYKNPEDLIGETGLLKQLTKQLLEREMQAEMTEHLGYEKNAPAKKKPRTPATAVMRSELKGSLEIWILLFPETVIPALSRSFFPKGRVASRVLMIKSLPSMHGP